MAKGINDDLANVLSSVMRDLSDLTIDLLGTEASILRITKSTPDLMGQYKETLEATLIDKVTIQYPSGDIRLSDSVDNQVTKTEAFSMWDILPIKLKIPFKTDESYENTAVSIKEGDIIVHVFLDEHGNKIPIKMEVTTINGNFKIRFLVRREYNLTLYRGVLSTEMETIIKDYVDTLEFEEC